MQRVAVLRLGGVVLAAGGFESNPQLRAAYLGPNWDLAKVRGSRYNTVATVNGTSFVIATGVDVTAERLAQQARADSEDGTGGRPHPDELRGRVLGEGGRVHRPRPVAGAEHPEAHGQTAPNWRSPASPSPGTM